MSMKKKSKSKKVKNVKVKLKKTKSFTTINKLVGFDELFAQKLLEVRSERKSKRVLKREQEIIGFCAKNKKAWQ